MRSKADTNSEEAEKAMRDIRRATRRLYSAEEKVHFVIAGLGGEDSVAELCRKEGINQNLYYRWSKASRAQKMPHNEFILLSGLEKTANPLHSDDRRSRRAVAQARTAPTGCAYHDLLSPMHSDSRSRANSRLKVQNVSVSRTGRILWRSSFCDKLLKSTTKNRNRENLAKSSRILSDGPLYTGL